jgi:hypothetical protein
MSVTETTPRLSLPALEKQASMAVLLGVLLVHGAHQDKWDHLSLHSTCLEKPPFSGSDWLTTRRLAAKWFYLPENTLNFEQCPSQLHASAACARPTR